MRHRTTMLLATAAVVVLATPALAASRPSLSTVSGPSPYADCTLGGPGTNYTGAEVEPFVAVNPADHKNLVGAWQQDRWRDGGAHGLVAGSSTDGGKTWTTTPLPFSACAPGGPRYTRASDAWVSIGPDGTVYANAISFDETDNDNGVFAATSTDGGKTWKNLATVDEHTGTTQYFDDKNSITANPGEAGVAYSVWDTLVSPNANPYADAHASAYTGPGYFSRTTDGGKTWSKPKAIFPTGERSQTIGNRVVVDPRHPDTLYDFANWIVRPNTPNSEHDQLAFVKSTDGGATWSAPKAIADMNVVGVADPNTGAAVRTGDIIPEAAVGPDGSLHLVWQDAQFSGGAYDEIGYTTSRDGGATWSAPRRVNTPTGSPAFTPSVAVSSNGTVGVTYYDLRGLKPGDTTTVPTDYWFTSSSDGGRTWGGEKRLGTTFDMTAAPTAGGYFTGDYESLDTAGTTFVPFFVRTNCAPGSTTPCDTADRTDVYSATITP
ncbi:sialidase family protein [Streptomyces beihaiensis]|uniref:Glycoside hydrolase n=1 Tax=Streptomyces beihaiensis TaxID=2984495 RepID=A0ABT3TXK0_9ACTN|nr:sialidase family protein [Streptomyces beihaiensis]MCX3060688.1 glycoside hydrolase [Streptomyces beihaiensis]